MVHNTYSLFYKKQYKLNIDTDSRTISKIIENELNQIEELEVYKLHKEELIKNISIETYMNEYHIRILLLNNNLPEVEVYENKEFKMKENEKFNKELKKYILGEICL